MEVTETLFYITSAICSLLSAIETWRVSKFQLFLMEHINGFGREPSLQSHPNKDSTQPISLADPLCVPSASSLKHYSPANPRPWVLQLESDPLGLSL